MLLSAQHQSIFTLQYWLTPRLFVNITVAITTGEWFTITTRRFHGIFNAVITKTAEVTVAPTMLLNGYRLHDLYRLRDLTYMLE